MDEKHYQLHAVILRVIELTQLLHTALGIERIHACICAVEGCEIDNVANVGEVCQLIKSQSACFTVTARSLRMPDWIFAMWTGLCLLGFITFAILAFRNWRGSTFPDVMTWAPMSFSLLCVGIAYWIVRVYRSPVDVTIEIRGKDLVLTGINGVIPLSDLRVTIGEAIQITDDGAGVFAGSALIIEVQDLSEFLQLSGPQSALLSFHYRDRMQFLLGKHVSEEQARSFIRAIELHQESLS